MGKNLGTVHLNPDDKKYWSKISEFCFSKWAFLFLSLGLVLFLVDWFIDVTLLLAYGRGEQWTEFGLTIFILLGSGIVTSLLYRVNQQWIDDKHEYLDNNSKYKVIWERVRWASQILLLTPVFRVIFCWKDLKSKKKLIRQHARVERQPISKEEVEAVVSVSERYIANHSFNMVESFLESIPQGIIQIYIASLLGEDLQLTTWTDWIRFFSIVSPVLTAALSSTLYTAAYFDHVQTLHFEDYFCFGRKIEFVTFGLVCTVALFLANTFVIGSRFCGIAFLFINYGAVGLGFIPFLYVVQFIWLQMYPSGRMSYDNPPRGITSTCSNLVDRWINVFTFSMVHPNIKNFLVYQCIFVILFWAFIGVLTPLPSADAMFFQSLTSNISLLNETSFTVLGAAVGATSFNLSSITLSDITYDQLFTSQKYVLCIWLASLLFSGFYLYALRREKNLIPRHFPLTKVYRFWEDLLKNTKSGLNARMRRHICLCVLADDVDLYKVQDHFNFICGFGRDKCLQKLDRLWIKYCSKLHPAITSNRHDLVIKWTAVKNRMALNGSLDMFKAWMDQALDGEYDFTATDDDSEELDISKLLLRHEEDIQMFFIMCSSFEDYMAAMNSFRFGKISNILNLDLHPFPCYPLAMCSSVWSGILAVALGAAHFWGMNSEGGSPSPPNP